ncbi:hypothetical protein CBS101457_006096 [Exobasidium rhododendri]|nr:hypothetical protein CBS101457_006096 [Exobasidium rhododendri]
MAVKSKQDDRSETTRAQEEEPVPSYEEALAGSAGSSSSALQQAASSAAPPSHGQHGSGKVSSGPPPPPKTTKATTPSIAANSYPFPSAPRQQGYGQSPYQPDGTLRIAIVQSDGQVLPLHATAVRRGPRAGRRFLLALFWAVTLYIILGALMGMIIEMADQSNQPTTPPGWKHHHSDQKIRIR